MKNNYITHNLIETKDLAGKIINQLIAPDEKRNNALVIGLVGDLGAGKTAFTQGVAEALGIKKHVTSPTFVIFKKFKILKNKKAKNLIHVDVYRLPSAKDIVSLGWENLIKNPENIIIVEWADKIKSVVPKNCVIIKINHKKENERKFTIKQN